jgi:hypothetical protein
MQRTPLKAALTVVGALALVGSTFTGTAVATGSHGGHHAKAERSTWTEDNDRNDGGTPNDVADAGDDRRPSGKDRSVEHGRSGNQGRATSDPDGVSNGGADKPNGPGGIDKADQDGNNGCGNDDDFEDDNNGNCGKAHRKAAEASKPAKQRCACGEAKPAAKPAEVEHGTTSCDRRNDERAQRAVRAELRQPKPVEAKPVPAKPAAVEVHHVAKPAEVEHGTTSCDRRNDERAQRAVRVERQAPVAAAKPVEVASSARAAALAPRTTTSAAARPATVPTCPAGASAEEAMLAGCKAAGARSAVPGEVLGEHAVAAAATAGPTVTSIPGEVLAASAVAAPASTGNGSGGGNVIANAIGGILAFTGANLLVLLAAALLTLLVGWLLLQADRKRSAD